jgi:hypothetical protein
LSWVPRPKIDDVYKLVDYSFVASIAGSGNMPVPFLTGLVGSVSYQKDFEKIIRIENIFDKKTLDIIRYT